MALRQRIRLSRYSQLGFLTALSLPKELDKALGLPYRVSTFKCHMWLIDSPNPYEFEQSWEWTFLKELTLVNTKLALNFFHF